MKLLTHTKPLFIPSTLLILSIALTGCGSGSSKKQDSPPIATSVSSATTSSSSVATTSSVTTTSSPTSTSSVTTSSSSVITTSSSTPGSLATSSSSSKLSTSSSSSAVSSSALSLSTSPSSKSSSSTSSSLVAKTGVFVDSAVQGLHYETTPGGFSGTTSANGEYQYAEGDTVTFSIGSLQFPSVTAKGVVTPLDLAKTSDVTNRIAINIAALLQSLDTDGNADNGISINYATAAAQATALNFDLPYATFAALPAVVNLTANSGSSIKTLVAETSASTHLQTSINTLNSADIIGTWYATSGNDSKYVLFVLNSSQYTLLSYEGGATIETGIYSWDKNTSQLTSTRNALAGSASASHPFANGSVLSVNQNTITSKNWSGTTVFSKLASSTNPLLGGWVKGASAAAYTENYYFFGQIGASDHAGHSGAEYGTYSRNGNNIIYKTLADTNGQWGFSHPCNIVDSHVGTTPNDLSCLNGTGMQDTITVNGDTIDMYSAANALANQTNDTFPDEPEHLFLQRVVQNTFDVFNAPSPLLGSWTYKGTDTFIFSDYKTFTHIKTSTDDPNCQPGMVIANYTWDPKTFLFNLNVLNDTTGSDQNEEGGCAVDSRFNRLTPNGSTLVLSDGTDGNEGVNQFTFTKNASNTNSLLGAWKLIYSEGTFILTFTDTGFFLANFDNQDDGDGAMTGVETGSYTFSGGKLTVKVTTDTDGSAGLSNRNNQPMSAIVSGDTLTIEGAIVYQRIK